MVYYYQTCPGTYWACRDESWPAVHFVSNFIIYLYLRSFTGTVTFAVIWELIELFIGDIIYAITGGEIAFFVVRISLSLSLCVCAVLTQSSF